MGNTPAKPVVSYKKDYYEMLGVSKNATEEEIRKAYKRKAMLLHPDKSTKTQSEASEEFSFLQEAYKVLSDQTQRKEYDKIKEDGFEEEIFDQVEKDIDSFQKRSCFNNFDNSPDGFFSVYTDLFQRIEKTEKEASQKNGIHFIKRKEFGCLESEYKPHIEMFYFQWRAFSSVRTFKEYQQWDIKSGQNRWEKRELKKKNKKIQEETKRKFEDSVRALVYFLMKIDPRIKLHYKKEIKKEREKIREKIREKKTNQIIEDYYNSPEIERLAKEMEKNQIEEKNKRFECSFCLKTYKKEGLLKSHLNTKEHRKKMIELGIEGSPLEKKKEIEKRLVCNVCGECFKSRNDLFKHINKLQHALKK